MEGVYEKKLRVIPDGRGRLVEILRADERIFHAFGQVYITTVLPEVVKAWHAHRFQRDYLACVAGMVKLVLFDDREGSPTCGTFREYHMGIHNPILVSVPPLVWHGFKGLGPDEAIIVNAPTRPYDHGNPDELRNDPHTSPIPYNWSRRDG